jgi:radical SAM/Cys-rich protein
MNDFEKRVKTVAGDALCSLDVEILQVNLGLKCNQECYHCHLEASSRRQEMMDWPTMELVLKAAREVGCRVVDLTGGAPELNPHFRRFLVALRQQGHPVQARTNLTALLEPGFEDLADFFRDHQIQLVASMPCYLEENVRAQRGKGVYEKSIAALQRLNALGYGRQPDLPLNLVYNPGGPFLPPSQGGLEDDYRQELRERFGIFFTRLLTITNMPLGRFQKELRRHQQEQQYLQLLRTSFNPQTVPGLMCRHQLSVGWDGTLYDCDFNLALGLPVNHGVPDNIRSFRAPDLRSRRIVTGEHCFACTAGSGSSCGGALV